MARIRSVKPEYWDDRKLAKRTSRDARLLYIALWNHADEHGRLQGDPQWIKGQAFPFDDDLDAAAIGRLLKELESVGAVVPYEADEDPYLFLPKLARHQRLEPEKVKSRLPAPPSESGADSSERRADSSAQDAYESQSHADPSESGADSSALLYVAGSREQGAGSRSPREAPTLPGTTLLDGYLAKTKPRPPKDDVQKLAEVIDRLVDEKTPVDVIAEALERYRDKTQYGPGLLRRLAGDVVKDRTSAAAGKTPRGSPRGHQPYRNPDDDSAYEKDL